MRMSPRLKARRGRFGAGGLSGPTLRITAPSGGTDVGGAGGSGSPTTSFVGTASDDLDGDISANIVWHVGALPAGSPSTGDATGATVTLNAALTFGSPVTSQVVTATVVDSGGKRSTVNVSVTA